MGSPFNMKADDKLLRKRLNARLRQQRCRARKRTTQKKHQEIQEMISPRPIRYLENEIVSNTLQRHLETKPYVRRCSISTSMLQDSPINSILSDEQSLSSISRESFPPLRSNIYQVHPGPHQNVVSPSFDHEDELRHTAIDAMLSLRNVFFNHNSSYPMESCRANKVVWSRGKCVVPKWSDLQYQSRRSNSFEPGNAQRPHYMPMPISNGEVFTHGRYIYPY